MGSLDGTLEEATIVYLEFESLLPHQNASLGRHKKLIDYCYFVRCKVLLIFKRALRSRGQCPESEHDAMRLCHKMSLFGSVSLGQESRHGTHGTPLVGAYTQVSNI